MIEKLCCLECVKLTQLQPDDLIIEIKNRQPGSQLTPYSC